MLYDGSLFGAHRSSSLHSVNVVLKLWKNRDYHELRLSSQLPSIKRGNVPFCVQNRTTRMR